MITACISMFWYSWESYFRTARVLYKTIKHWGERNWKVLEMNLSHGNLKICKLEAVSLNFKQDHCQMWWMLKSIYSLRLPPKGAVTGPRSSQKPFMCVQRGFLALQNMQTGLSCRILNYTTPLKNRTIFLFCFYTEYIKPLMANFPVSS